MASSRSSVKVRIAASRKRDAATGTVTLSIVDDFGELRDSDHGLVNGSIARESWTIDPADPLVGPWRDALDANLVAKRMVGSHRDLHDNAIRRGKFPSDRPHRSLRRRCACLRTRFRGDVAARPYLTARRLVQKRHTIYATECRIRSCRSLCACGQYSAQTNSRTLPVETNRVRNTHVE